MENTLSRFSDALKEQSRQKEEQRLAWEKSLGEPALFIPSEDPEAREKGMGLGYFVYEDGSVLEVRKYANGYAMHARTIYELQFIRTLAKLAGLIKG